MNKKKKLLINVLRLAWGVLGIFVVILSTIHYLPNLVDYTDYSFSKISLSSYPLSSDPISEFVMVTMAYLLNMMIICVFIAMVFPAIEMILLFKRKGVRGVRKHISISNLRSIRERREFYEIATKYRKKEKRRKVLLKKYRISPLPYLFLGLFLGFILFK